MKKYLLISAIIGLILYGSFAFFDVSRASSSCTGNFVCLNGWAWSPNVGWISFSSDNTGAGGPGSYSVKISTSTSAKAGEVGDTIGLFSGNAWSSNIGWLSFDRSATGNPPSDDATAGELSVARVNMKTGKVEGWVRALGGCLSDMWDKSNKKCLGSEAGSDNGVSNLSNIGWNGWIHLSGPNHISPDFSAADNTSSKGVTFSTTTGKFSGLAWGDDVVGWMKWNATESSTAGCNPVEDCGVVTIGLPKVNIDTSPSAVSSIGSTTYITWFSVGADLCSGSGSGWDGDLATSGVSVPFIITEESTSFTLTCSNEAGPSSISRSVVVDPSIISGSVLFCSQPVNTNLCTYATTTTDGVSERVIRNTKDECSNEQTSCEWYCSNGFALHAGQCVQAGQTEY